MQTRMPDLVNTLKLWGEYQCLGVPPTASVFSTIVCVYSLARCDRVAVEMFKDVSAKYGLRMLMFAYESLIVSALRLEDVALVVEMLERV